MLFQPDEGVKYIFYLDYNQAEGMSKFSECPTTNCIITGNENFIARNGMHLFDAVVLNLESLKEDYVRYDVIFLSHVLCYLRNPFTFRKQARW